MPLIYNGQEAGNTKRLQFFDKDPIVWKAHPNGDLYKKLIELKKQNTALWNAHWGARMMDVTNSAPDAVFSFVRRNEKDKVFTVINFSAQPQTITFKDTLYHGKYTEYLNGQATELRRLQQGDTKTLGGEDLREITGIRVLAAQRRHNLSPERNRGEAAF